MLELRMAREGDALAYGGGNMPEDWCIEGKVYGYVAVRGEDIIAFGAVTWDKYGQAWAWYSSKEKLSPFFVHRKIVAMIGLLREVGEPALHAIRNENIDGSDAWLRRLGFREAPEMKTDLGPVWKCDLRS